MKHQVNEIKVSYKERIPAAFWKKINSSSDAAELLFENWNKDTIALHESFKIVMLSNANKVKGVYQISQGGITGTLVDLRLLFSVALKCLAPALILTHNHPSGTLRPSDADKQITQKIKEAGKLLDISILDHLILVPNGDYYSFADNHIL